MKIGLYKLGIKSSDVNLQNDKNGRFMELLALKEIFEGKGHDVSLLFKGMKIVGKFDAIYVLNGIGTISEVYNLEECTDYLAYILTDLRLVYDWLYLFDAVYTQAPRDIQFIDTIQFYSGMPELAAYCGRNELLVEQKSNLFVFGGGARNRNNDIDEYIIGNNFDFLGKIGNYYDKRLSIIEYHNLLMKTKYSILICDPEYNEYGFITWRYFENIVRHVITFIDNKCDKYLLIKDKVDPFLIVSNGMELREKIKELEHNKQKMVDVYLSQDHLINAYNLSGDFTYDCLMRR